MIMSTPLRIAAKTQVTRLSVYQQIADDLAKVFDPFYQPVQPVQMHVVKVMSIIGRNRVDPNSDRLKRDFLRIAEDMNRARALVGPTVTADAND